MLTLAEEALLLAVDETDGRFARVPEYSLEFATAGGVLAELALRDRIDSDLDSLTVLDETPTGDDLLDPVLRALVGRGDEQDLRKWLLHLTRVEALRTRAFERLVERGVLRPGKKPLLGRARHEILAPAEVASRKDRVREILTTNVIPEPREILLVCLGHACSLLGSVLGRAELDACAERIAVVTRLDLIGQSMLRELVETRALVDRVGWWGDRRAELEAGPPRASN